MMGTHGLLTRAFSVGALFLNRVSQVNNKPHTMGLRSDVINKFRQMKIPEKPKKPLCPYIKFVQDVRPIIARENPNFKPTDIVKRCSRDWNNASAELKEKYTKQFKDEQQEYDKKILNYNASLTIEQREAINVFEGEKRKDRQKRKLRKLIKQTDKPKKPILPFMRYYLEQSRIKNIPIKELLLNSKGVWINMPESEKIKYEKQYKEEKEQYDTALEEWEMRMIEEGHPELVRSKILEQGRPTRIRQTKKPKSE